MTDIKITLTSQRKLIAIESENFRIKLNGKTNADYKAAFKVFGVELVFEDEKAEFDIIETRDGTLQLSE